MPVPKEKKKKKKSPMTLAKEFFQNFGLASVDVEGVPVPKQCLVSWRGDFYEWEAGRYVRAKDLEAKVRGFLGACGEVVTTDLVRQVIFNLGTPAYLLHRRELNTWLTDKDTDSMTVPIEGIITKRGIMTFETDGGITMQPPTPDFFCLNRLPYEYDPEGTCPQWLAFLEEVTKGNKDLQRMLQQWAGYLLMTSHRYQCFLLLIGDAATGKGTFSKVMTAMLGAENCSAVPLRRFADKHSLYATYGKMLNVAGDAEQELTPASEAVIKAWSGGDMLDFERKYSDNFAAYPTAKLMISANDFPTFTDKSRGTWRRLRLVKFEREDTSIVDPKLGDRLLEELPGILNWAIEGRRDLEEAGELVAVESSRELAAAFQEEANPAGVFLKENYEYQRGRVGGIGPSKLYETYRKWCRQKGYLPLSDKSLGKEVKRAFPRVKKRKLGSRAARFRVYEGLVLRSDAEVRGSSYR
jgi:P4 family phage/plasmid primase-like protien